MTTPPVSALIRASLFVRDLEKAAAFYRALGLEEVYYEGVLEDASASRIIGFAEPHPYPIRILKRPGPNYGMIGLFQLAEGHHAEMLPTPTGPARIGEVALIFYVRSMAETLAALRAAGATWSPEPETFRMGHREQAEVCLRDCDGVLLNLVETDPAQQERTRPELDYAPEP
jgi:catechol 2,3-dioxygenase-like lactoylglutathione lyase family enzyme